MRGCTAQKQRLRMKVRRGLLFFTPSEEGRNLKMLYWDTCSTDWSLLPTVLNVLVLSFHRTERTSFSKLLIYGAKENYDPLFRSSPSSPLRI